MQLGFYFDQTRCTGCGACQVACKDWHDIAAGPVKWMRIDYSEKGKYPDVFVAYAAIPCFHCQEPLCASACPADAIEKREHDGIVVVNTDACLGNGTCDVKCLKACPYGAPQFGPEEGAKMGKCTFCLDRWESDRLPICVEACPTRALDAGPMDDLIARYGETRAAEGLAYSARTKPAVVCKPKLFEG
jgi:anaerobic dimethyl sulfoxide reductase subunit B